MVDYHTLDNQVREFRVVDIHPSEARTSTVHGALRHARLGSEPPPIYETVSYVWGDPTNRDVMEVNGIVVDVPASSVAALQRIRSKHVVRTLWIDALCINQKDVHERSEQVRMMGDIYRSSQGNLIYLGEVRDVQKTEMALSDIQAIIKEMNEETENLTVVDGTVFDPWRKESPQLARSGMRVKVREEVLISQIFDLSWFRLWVFQEAALAPSNTCILGDHTFRFLDIARASHWIAHKQRYVSKALIASHGRGVASALFDYIDETHGKSASGADDQVMLAQLISDTYEMLATDPRDKLYATLGLRNWPNGIPELLAPDYSKAEAQVFRDASRFSLQTPGEEGLDGLQTLCMHDEDLRSDNFISWITFPGRAYNPVLEPEIFQAHLFSCNNNEEQPLPTSQSSSDVDSEVLKVTGIALDRVETVSLQLTRAITGDVHALNNWLTDTSNMLQESSPNEAGVIAALLMAGANADTELATKEDWNSFDDFQWSIQYGERIPATPDQTRASAEYLSAQNDSDSRASRYFSAFQRACVNRVVFRTKNNYIGLGSNLLRDGDVVAIFYGTDLPFALRLNGQDQYQILGPCYVHGIMFGEAVKQHRERCEKDAVFSIR